MPLAVPPMLSKPIRNHESRCLQLPAGTSNCLLFLDPTISPIANSRPFCTFWRVTQRWMHEHPRMSQCSENQEGIARREVVGGLGSSHTVPCGTAVPARPPTHRLNSLGSPQNSDNGPMAPLSGVPGS